MSGGNVLGAATTAGAVASVLPNTFGDHWSPLAIAIAVAVSGVMGSLVFSKLFKLAAKLF